MAVSRALPLKFLAWAAALLVVWVVLYEGYLRPLGQPDDFLTHLTAVEGKVVLQLLGVETSVGKVAEGSMLYHQGEEVLGIAKNCNGLVVFALFAAFILIFPGNSTHKPWYIPAGILGLFLLNGLRVALLTLIQLQHPSWLDFNHKYTFTILMYGAVFGLWMLWVNKFATPSPPSKSFASA
jgi:exosortase family protein XrtF